MTTLRVANQHKTSILSLMAKDKYSAIWISHTSINDFLFCPRSYFLKNIYRDPKTGHKVKLISPPLSLGQAIHETLESLSVLPVEHRFKESLVVKFHHIWEKVSGEKGGFNDSDTEHKYRKRGEEMLIKIMRNPGPLRNKAVKIKMDLPYYWFSEKDNIILCGKIDWLEYLSETDSVHIIDFKTNKVEESFESLQLPIYHLLVTNCQNRQVTKASYWYLEKEKGLIEKKLPNIKEAYDKVLEIAKKIKIARQLNVFKCPHKTGCRACKPMEAVIKGEGKFVGNDEYNGDVYIAKNINYEDKESMIL